MTAGKKEYGNVIDMEQYSKDGRLTEATDGKVYDYRKMLEEIERLGRPMTLREASEYRVK